MGSGVGWHGQLQTGTYPREIRRIFQVGEDKPLLIHIIGLSYFLFYIFFKLVRMLSCVENCYYFNLFFIQINSVVKGCLFSDDTFIKIIEF